VVTDRAVRLRPAVDRPKFPLPICSVRVNGTHPTPVFVLPVKELDAGEVPIQPAASVSVEYELLGKGPGVTAPEKLANAMFNSASAIAIESASAVTLNVKEKNINKKIRKKKALVLAMFASAQDRNTYKYSTVEARLVPTLFAEKEHLAALRERKYLP
jgi:hypothetical protein